MTLTQYLNQTKPQRLDVGTVELTDNEIQIVTRIKRLNCVENTLVFVPEFNANYIIIQGSNILKTIDNFGNPQSPSVFSYKLPTE